MIKKIKELLYEEFGFWNDLSKCCDDIKFKNFENVNELIVRYPRLIKRIDTEGRVNKIVL